jgi:hypothetical protein
MDEQAILIALQKLIESGALDNMQEPGKQTLIIYGLLAALIITLIRIFLINGWLRKGFERFFALEEAKVKHLFDLNEKVVNLQQEIVDLHQKLYDMLNLLHAKRQSDQSG